MLCVESGTPSNTSVQVCGTIGCLEVEDSVDGRQCGVVELDRVCRRVTVVGVVR